MLYLSLHQEHVSASGSGGEGERVMKVSVLCSAGQSRGPH